MVEQKLSELKNHDLEKSVLGAIILESNIYPKISDYFHLGLFTNPDLQNVAKVIIRLKNSGQQCDLVSIGSLMKKSDYLNNRFDYYHLTQITDRVAGTALIEQHIFMLQELYMKRKLIEVSEDNIRRANAYGTDALDLLDGAAKNISDISSIIVGSRFETSEELYKKSLERNQAIIERKGKLVGITTGFRKIDEVTGGWQKGKLIVLAGATSMGKTALALDFLLNAAVAGHSVAMFTLEMPNEEVYARLQSKLSGIDLSEINNTGIKEGKLQSFKLSCETLQNSKMYFDDTSGISIFQLKNRVRKLKELYNVELVVIDYLQLMEGEKKGNREQEVASISRGLKSLAKELSISIIALSQLSRDIDKRPMDQKEPKLSDLRESGSLEQDADIVAFVYRPEYYGITEAESGESLIGKGKFLIKKHRGGPWADIKLDWIGRLTKYQSEGVEPMGTIEPNYNF